MVAMPFAFRYLGTESKRFIHLTWNTELYIIFILKHFTAGFKHPKYVYAEMISFLQRFVLPLSEVARRVQDLEG